MVKNLTTNNRIIKNKSFNSLLRNKVKTDGALKSPADHKNKLQLTDAQIENPPGQLTRRQSLGSILVSV